MEGGVKDAGVENGVCRGGGGGWGVQRWGEG